MSWFERLIPKIGNNKGSKSKIPEGLWSNCSNCKHVQYHPELQANLYVCSKCNFHHIIDAQTRIASLLDAEKITYLESNQKLHDPLKFKDTKKYKDRWSAAQKQSKEHDAFKVAYGSIQAQPVVLGVFSFNFMGGSMGSHVGHMFVKGVEQAISLKCPYVVCTASGGARMQEGIVSLMQMAKTATAIEKLSQHNLPYITILTHPTMGGVSASLAMLGDIIIAEPGALIGFAGPRVIEQTVRHKLPEGFQRSEFLLEKGQIDMLVERKLMKTTIAGLMEHLTSNAR